MTHRSISLTTSTTTGLVDPAIVDAALMDPASLLRATDVPDAWERVIDAEPVLFVPFRDATSGLDTYGAGRYVDVPYDSLLQKLTTSAAGGELPDLVRADLGWVPQRPALDAIVALNFSYSVFKTRDELRGAGSQLSMPTRESLAAEAFAYTARYDTAIAREAMGETLSRIARCELLGA